MIPKKIHYCWFGNNPKNELIQKCINSWKHFLPDYEITEWNESNTDLSTPFVKQAYKQKKWAFVADYIRLQKLYEIGGVYLDTDMLLLKNIDNLLSHSFFIGAEENTKLSAGIIGAIPKHNFVKSLLNNYQSLKISNKIDLFSIAIPKIITANFISNYIHKKDFSEKVLVDDITIYPPTYFYPLPPSKSTDVANYKKYITKDSLAIHLWNESWVEPNEFEYIRKGKYLKGFHRILYTPTQKRSSFLYFRKVLSAIKTSFKK